jgi:hypothetical protein
LVIWCFGSFNEPNPNRLLIIKPASDFHGLSEFLTWSNRIYVTTWMSYRSVRDGRDVASNGHDFARNSLSLALVSQLTLHYCCHQVVYKLFSNCSRVVDKGLIAGPEKGVVKAKKAKI